MTFWIAGVLAYYAAGVWFVGRPFVVRQMEAHIRDFPNLTSEGELSYERTAMSAIGLLLSAIWPLALVGRLMTQGMSALAPMSKSEAELRLKAREKRITELERELGIGR